MRAKGWAVWALTGTLVASGAAGASYEKLIKRGVEAYEAGRWEEALASFRKADEKRPDRWDVAVDMAWCLYQLKRYPEAEASFRRALSLNDHADAYEGLSRSLYAQVKVDAALVVSQRWAELAPRSPLAHIAVGWNAYAVGKADVAATEFRIAATLDDSWEPHYGLGQSLCDLGDFDGALREARVAAGKPATGQQRRKTGDLEGRALLGLGRWDESRAAFGRNVIGAMVGARPEGIALTFVWTNGPVARAGLEDGDLLTALAGTDLAGFDPEMFLAMVESLPAGRELPVSVVRGGQTFETRVNLRPGALPGAPPSGAPWLGVTVAVASGGVLVRDVDAGGPAAAAGLQAGDLLVSWGDRMLSDTTAEAFAALVRDAGAGAAVRLGYVRGGALTQCTATVAAAP